MASESGTRIASWVLAVDFGTSSTAAAIGRDGGAQLVGLDGGLPRMLSNVFWQESTGRLLLGDVADNASALAPWCFERCPKVKLGQQYMLLGEERVRVSDAVGAVLGRVKDEAVRVRGGEQPGAVRLTHPVRWGDEKRDALVEAAGVAGLEEPELVLEPVAAAMHYASERLRPGEHVAVYDLGGGTLDTAVLQRTDSGFEVVGVPRGRDGFGGEEFDHRLYRFLGAQLPDEDWLRLRSEPDETGDNAWPKANRQFQRNVRRAKELLTNNPQVDVDVPSPVNRALVLTVDDLNGLISLDVEDSVRELERTIQSAGLEPGQLTAVYLTGGSSQIPLVGRLIHEQLGIQPEHLNDPKAVICLGAALKTGAAPPPKRRPMWTRPPELRGQPSVGERLTVAAGSVEGEHTGELTYQWQRCAPDATEPTNIAGAEQESYQLGSDDAGYRLRALVSARSAAGDIPTLTQWTDAVTLVSGGKETVARGAAAELTQVDVPDPEVTRESPAAVAPPTQRSRQPSGVGPPKRADIARRRRTAAIVGALVAVIAVVGVGAVLLSGGKSGSAKSGTTTATAARTAISGPIAVAYAPPWRVANADVAGNFALGGTLATAGSASAAGATQTTELTTGPVTLAAGVLKNSAPIPGDAPPRLVARYGHPTSSTDASVAGAKARAYTWAPSGQRVLAYVIPTPDGDLAIICQAPFAGGASLQSCTDLANRAKLSGVQLLAPGPDLTFGQAVNRGLTPVVGVRGGLHGLGDSTLSARAPKATRLAATETSAAAAIAAVQAPSRYRSVVANLNSALKTEARQLQRIGQGRACR